MSLKKTNTPNHFSERNAREAAALRENLKRRRQSKEKFIPADEKDVCK